MTSQPRQRQVPGRPFVVSIVGPSATGKSQLAKRVMTELGEDLACRVPADSFFIPRPQGQSMPEFLRQPLQYDWSLLGRLLALPIRTAVTTPDADFTRFRRRAESGGRPFRIRPVMIVDAMAAFPTADLLARLDVPDDVRRERLRERDVRWGSHVLANWDHLTFTWRASLAALAEMRGPELTLDGEEPVEVNAAALAEKIRTHMDGHSETGRTTGWGRGSTGFGSDRMG